MAESVHTHLMFQNGRAEEALRRYQEIFEDDFSIDDLDTHDEAAPGPTGQVQLAVCTLLGQRITCIDSPVEHDFGGQVFMPLDDYGFSRQYGWVEDGYGVPWQMNLR